MIIALLTAELRVNEAQSLKDKRQVLRSLIAKLRADFNVSVAEVEHQDLWQRAGIAVAIVSADSAFADQVLAAVATRLESDPRWDLVHLSTELL